MAAKMKAADKFQAEQKKKLEAEKLALEFAKEHLALEKERECRHKGRPGIRVS